MGLIFRDTFKAKKETTSSYSSFEHMLVTLSCKSHTFVVAVVYRSPTVKTNGPTITNFLEEFPKFLEDILLLRKYIVIIGDFNIHIENKECNHARLFKDILDSTNLTQSVSQPTHCSGHTLDLILTRPDQVPISVEVEDILLSDHFSVRFTLPTSKPPLPKRELTYRRIKAIDIDSFASDIASSRLFSLDSENPDLLADTYNAVLRELLDKHAPVKTKTITVHPTAPWYGDDIAAAKKVRRKAEKKWRETGLTVHRQLYKEAKDNVTRLITQAKVSYYKDRIESSEDTQKTLFACVKDLLNENKPAKLPSSDSNQELADRIASFFSEKISKIRTYLEDVQKQFALDQGPEVILVPENATLTSFDAATEEEVRKIIMASASKSCILDPIPTYLLKKCLHVLLPFITKIINMSFKYAKVPDCFKIAAVIPLLKKVFLDPEVLNNLRPVSTLPFISKTLEKCAGKRIGSHKDKQQLHEKMQSAYREGHSTETALVRIQNDLLISIDKKQCVYLVLLDMSAAFDTVDHNVLLRRLSERFGIREQAIRWVESYLTNRKQFVTVSGTKSAEQEIECNVPQGSVLGPGLFSDYNSPVGDIFRKHGVEYHLYADDTQVYLSFAPGSEADALKRLENCLQDIRVWMAHNYLKLNDSKTDFMIIGSAHNLKHINTSHITIGEEQVAPSHCVKNIGATLDKHLKLDLQVNQTCKSAWFHLYQLGKIKNYLSDSQLRSVVQAFVVSKLDQNNSLLAGAPKYQISKLQSVQNAAAKLVSGLKRYDHVDPPLEDLHWLPVEYRINYKLLLLGYKCLNGHGPQYLHELLTPYAPSRPLRSSSANTLVEPRSSMKTYGDRAFSVVVPRLWNRLPQNVKDCSSVNAFKKALKTHLFKKAYSK